jgi:hypothetical protein
MAISADRIRLDGEITHACVRAMVEGNLADVSFIAFFVYFV